MIGDRRITELSEVEFRGSLGAAFHDYAQRPYGLVRWEGRHPKPAEVHKALSSWAFNVTAHKAGCPPNLQEVIRWVEEHSVDLAELGDADLLRAVLERLNQTLDGGKAAPSTYARKRATVFNALGYAAEKKHFDVNPLLTITWRAPKNTDTIDRRRVVNESKGTRLVVAVGYIGAMGRHLKAFFGCLFYAGLRPGEAAALTEDELEFREDDDDWGWFHLEDSSPETSGAWTDSGKREVRQLKHRSERETRPVPMNPLLVRLLRWHLAVFGTGPDGRLFRSENGGLLSESTYTRIWGQAREEVLRPAEVKSVLAQRPYDLRHARLSIWLNAGIAPPQIAEWAGNSVRVLLQVYAKCLIDSVDTALEKLGRKRPTSVSELDPDTPDLELDDKSLIEGTTVYELAISYLEGKWETVKPTTRRGLVEALTKVTMVSLTPEGPWPTEVQLGQDLTSWAYSKDRWAEIPNGQADVIAWVEDHSAEIAALSALTGSLPYSPIWAAG